MSKFHRLIQMTVLAGFVGLTSGCIIAPDGEHDRGAHEHEGDHGDHHCDEHDEHCGDRR